MPRNSVRTQSDSSNQPERPALTPEARESQMINMAYNLAEQQLRDGTASSQVITHFLKLGTEREKREVEKLKHDNLLTEAKIEALKSAKNMEKMYIDAMEAMKDYGGHRNDRRSEKDQEL